MESKMLKNLAIRSFGLMLTVICMSILVNRYNDVIIYANDSQLNYSNIKPEYASFQLQNLINLGLEDTKQGDLGTTVPIEDIIGKNYLKIAKLDKNYYKINLEDLYETHSIKVTINHLPEQYYNDQSVQFVKDENKNTLVEDSDLSYEQNEDQTYNAVFHITLDTVYAYSIYENDSFIYINLLNPRDVYDKILVIDAGHGGSDVGTYTPDMKHYEKDINLKVVLDLKKLLDKENIKVYYTRTTDKKVYLNPRIDLANNVKADYMISVHCNSNKDGRPNGTEVLYKNYQKLARVCLDSVVNETGTKKLDIVRDKKIHIIKKAQVPIALIEVAFMSNKKDLNYLIQDKNQKEIAKGIYKAIMTMYENDK